MRLALDHHYSSQIAAVLRSQGHDVVAAVERGWQLLADEELLSVCAGEQRALLTNDVGDFALVARRWNAEGRGHAGLVFTSDASMPRSRRSIGVYVEALDAVMKANLGNDALADRIWWLQPPRAMSEPG